MVIMLVSIGSLMTQITEATLELAIAPTVSGILRQATMMDVYDSPSHATNSIGLVIVKLW